MYEWVCACMHACMGARVRVRVWVCVRVCECVCVRAGVSVVIVFVLRMCECVCWPTYRWRTLEFRRLWLDPLRVSFCLRRRSMLRRWWRTWLAARCWRRDLQRQSADAPPWCRRLCSWRPPCTPSWRRSARSRPWWSIQADQSSSQPSSSRWWRRRASHHWTPSDPSWRRWRTGPSPTSYSYRYCRRSRARTPRRQCSLLRLVARQRTLVTLRIG